ncbi:MAG: hypothetical protein ACYTHM_19810 [Planctomycetota bacterium]|jgi:Tfp pilus assembly protein PilN
MIKVNLLPPEYRVKERTPLPMMMGIIGGVAVTALVVVAFLYLRLGKLPEITRTLKNKEATRDFYKQKAMKADKLKAERAKLNELDQAVKKLRGTCYPWTKALDDLSRGVDRANKGKKPVKAWFESLEFGFPKIHRVTRGQTQKPGGTIKAELVVAGMDYDHISVFRDNLRKSKGGWLERNIQAMPLTTIKPKEYKDYIPDVGLANPLEITLMPDPLLAKKAEKGKAKPGAGKGTSAGKGGSTPSSKGSSKGEDKKGK